MLLNQANHSLRAGSVRAYAASCPGTDHAVDTGVAAIPETWIPGQHSRAWVGGPLGSDTCDVERSSNRIYFHLDSALSPNIEAKDIQGGNTEITIEMPFPIPNLHYTGQLQRSGSQVMFEEQGGKHHSLQMWQENGRVYGTMREPGESDQTYQYVRTASNVDDDGDYFLAAPAGSPRPLS